MSGVTPDGMAGSGRTGSAHRGAPSIDVVIVNWNSGDFLRRCLASIQARVTPGLARVIVVDNASADHSMDGLPDLPDMVVHRNPANTGFARACNQGAAAGSAALILFLNPDTVVEPGALERVVEFMGSPEAAGVGACAVQLRHDDGRVARNCSRDPTARDMFFRSLFLDRIAPRLVRPHFLLEWDHADSRSVEQIMGAFYLVHRDVFEQLGGFDERFFVYYEEVDLSVRVRALGRTVHYLADTSVIHTGCGTTDSIRATRQFYVSRSRLQFAAKHFSRTGAAVAWAAILVLEPAARIVASLVRGDWTSARESARAAGLLWRALPALGRAELRAASGAPGASIPQPRSVA